ncbi:MAG: aminopeptidase P family protein [Clostridia bacterium]
MNLRMDKIKKIIKDKELDAILVTSRENTFYLSGFRGSASLILITPGNAFFCTDFRYIEAAKAICGKHYDVSMYKGDALPHLHEVTGGDSLGRIGFEENDLSFMRYSGFKGVFGKAELVPVQSFVDRTRIIKEDEEIIRIKKATEISEKAFGEVLPYIRPGVLELDILAEMEYRMRKGGASKQAFDTIVASGKRSSLPHGEASLKRIEQGDPVTLDFGAVWEGYCADMTRTVFAGQPSGKMKDIYRIVLEAQERAQEGVVAGASGREIDRIAREIINKNGYEGCFGHGLGHGVGILVHEEPRLSEKSESIMENNMVVSVEPGIYVEDIGGVRIENLVAIRDNNPYVFNETGKELLIL